MADFEYYDTTTEMFIEAVRRNPCLYDKNHERYKNVVATAQAWDEIATEMGKSGESSAVKTRWKNLKDCFLKHKRAIDPTHRNTSNKQIKQYLNWKWAEHMEFLAPFTSLKTKYYKRMERRHIKPKIKLKMTESNYTADSFSNNHDSDQPLNTIYLRNPEQNDFNQFNDDSGCSGGKRDDIYYLFHSYAETFRKFSPKRQVRMKVELANLFSKAEIEHLDEIEAIPESLPMDGTVKIDIHENSDDEFLVT